MRTSRTSRSIVLILLLLGAVPVHPVTIEEIPTPRPAGWSVDRTGRIPPATLQEIDRLGDEVKAKTGAELAVVVVGSLHGVPSRVFAVRLFNTWGIGDPARNNGVLVFAALDDHKAEVVLGSGIDNEQTRRTSDEIMQSEMVPRFRAGDPAAAVLLGAKEHARRILGVEMTAAPAPSSAPQKAVSQPAREPVPSPGGIWIAIVLLMFASVLAVLFIILWLLWRAVRSFRRKHREKFLSSDDSDSSSDSSSDSGFSGGSSDGGGSSGQW